MLEVDWDVRTVEGPPPANATDDPAGDTVSLVAAVVTNGTPVPRRVRLRPAFEGPVLPPRRRGVPEAGWCAEGFEGTVPAEGRLPLGFAAAGPPPEPPGEVLDRGRADDGDDGAPSPDGLLRDLGSPAPPREAVPAGDADGASPSPADGASPSPADGASPSPADGASPSPADAVPAHVGAWLDAVEDRLGRDAAESDDRPALREVAARTGELLDAGPTDGGSRPAASRER